MNSGYWILSSQIWFQPTYDGIALVNISSNNAVTERYIIHFLLMQRISNVAIDLTYVKRNSASKYLTKYMVAQIYRYKDRYHDFRKLQIYNVLSNPIT